MPYFNTASLRILLGLRCGMVRDYAREVSLAQVNCIMEYICPCGSLLLSSGSSLSLYMYSCMILPFSCSPVGVVSVDVCAAWYCLSLLPSVSGLSIRMWCMIVPFSFILDGWMLVCVCAAWYCPSPSPQWEWSQCMWTHVLYVFPALFHSLAL